MEVGFLCTPKLMQNNMKSDRQRRNFWMPSEIDMMLQLIEEIQRSHGCTSTTHSTFMQIANKMKKMGFTNKSAMQIRRKWFQMKSAYLCYKRGNYERIMLIPEEFRDKVAKFVETERKFCHIKLEKELYSQSNKSAKSETMPSAVTTPIIQVKGEMSKKGNIGQHNNKHHSSKDLNLDKQMQEFVSDIKEMQKVLLFDFKRMQEQLLTYQSKCQKMRAAKVRAFFENSLFDENSTEIY